MQTCSTSRSATIDNGRPATIPFEAPLESLREVVRRFGTPTFAYDLRVLRSQITKLRTYLPPDIDIVFSLKANASLGLCSFFARSGIGADVASAGELAIALEAGFAPERIFISGPDKSPSMMAQLRSAPTALLSIDSASELRTLAAQDLPYRALLRLRPDFRSFAACNAGPNSRFGLIGDDLADCRRLLGGAIRVVGFHIFSGSQVLDANGIIQQLRGAMDQARRAADTLGIVPEILNLGGGFGIPYGPDHSEMDLAAVAQELWTLRDRAAPARIMLELGRYLVAPSGWYLTSVLAHQTHLGRPAVVVDGGSHQRGDLCGLDLRHIMYAPVVLESRETTTQLTDILGCLSLPGDILAEAKPLPPLSLGDHVAFPNAGSYGLTASPALFHGHPLPAEVVFDGTKVQVIRGRSSVRSLLEGQFCLPESLVD
jgi:diaminopimelate decarboxylase